MELSISKSELESLSDCLEAELEKFKIHTESDLGTAKTYIIGDSFCVPKGYYDNIANIYSRVKALK